MYSNNFIEAVGTYSAFAHTIAISNLDFGALYDYKILYDYDIEDSEYGSTYCFYN